ncbi:hypothetical protein KHQ08_11225 [Pseudochrobactrum algeriensis]|uniref:hypothetical protein n=1 Tax=Pseudochrobactrum algeriensis TaxID=2834768 RepID=UPI001BCCDF24|nr:hypothetical protein [Pseudochrobactrum algeriensis]MBX8811783.1 hypothetical protein [Ochrobactrum sp. MR34]QVQ35790.1 hypothetical protein KHQ08_11225 [Pseudochrobactrum algeriensis]QVQ39006.1 hypothetical protein KHQ07_09525 [Pseudochrobactrum algeriensis]QVQ42924.1 hypothetical protein KHQ09_11480 [Pseudochrobactrum algeriensis]
MSAQQTHHFATLRNAMFAVAAVALAGCTSGPSAGVPQEGALRTGAYPNFGIMPRGETKQLSFEEKDRITGSLSSAKARQGSAPATGSSRAEIEARKRQLQAETDATLKAIEATE